MKTPLRALVLVLLTVSALCACGNKGDLVQPEKPAEARAER